MANLLYLNQPGFKHALSKSLFVGMVSGTLLFAGFTPALHRSSPNGLLVLMLSNTAYAQEAIPPDVLQNYARSLLAIEPIRQGAYDEIKRILGTGEVPPIVCHRPRVLENLNPSIRQIAVNYCNRSIQIVERNNLSITTFNTITLSIQSDPNLANLVREEIRRQQETPSGN